MYSIVDRESSRDIKPSPAGFLILLIFLVSCFFRYSYYQADIPLDIYEYPHLDAIGKLGQGWLQWDGSPGCFVSPNLFYPPGFYLLGLNAFHYIGNTVSYFRYMMLFSGMLSTFLIYLIGVQLASRRTGLYSALFYALYSDFLIINRLIIPQNLIIPYLLIIVYFLLRAKTTSKPLYLYSASILIGISSLFLYSIILFTILLMIVGYQVHKEKLKTYLVIALSPLLLFWISLVIVRPGLFFHDVFQSIIYGVAESPLRYPAWSNLKGLYYFIFHDWIIFLGFIGLLFYRAKFPWYLIFAVLSTALFSWKGMSISGGLLYPPLVLSIPFILLGTGRMTQIILDNISSLVNSLFHISSENAHRLFTPGRIISFLGFVYIVFVLFKNCLKGI